MDLEEIFNKNLDAAFILTPVESHYQICSSLIANGIHVFVEKPPAASAVETRKLAELAENNQRVFMVGFNRRFAPLVEYAKTMFSKEQIRMCILEKHRPGIQDRDLAEAYREDLIHQIDLLRFLCGEGKPLSTHGHNQNGMHVSSASLLETEAGGIGVIAGARESAAWQDRVTIIGAGKNLVLNLFQKAELMIENEAPVSWSLEVENQRSELRVRGFEKEFEHFFDCVRNQGKPLTDGYEAYRTQLLQESLVALWDSSKGE